MTADDPDLLRMICPGCHLDTFLIEHGDAWRCPDCNHITHVATDHTPRCGQGHALTPDNLYWEKDRRRRCKTCKREANRVIAARRYHRQKAAAA